MGAFTVVSFTTYKVPIGTSEESVGSMECPRVLEASLEFAERCREGVFDVKYKRELEGKAKRNPWRRADDRACSNIRSEYLPRRNDVTWVGAWRVDLRSIVETNETTPTVETRRQKAGRPPAERIKMNAREATEEKQ